MKHTWVKWLFLFSGFYDGLVGLVFFVAGFQIFDFFYVTRPNHIGYLQFPALLLVIFGIMFLRIASDPVRFRELIWYGVGLKLAYSGLVFYYYFTTGIPFMWIPFAILDVVFLGLYLLSLSRLRRPA
jgi:hypothetical protein